MQKVTLKVENPRGEEIHGVLIVEERRGDAWSRHSVKTIGVPDDATQELVLRDNQRLVFEPVSDTTEMVYDREQGASVDPRKQYGVSEADVTRANRPDPKAKVEPLPKPPLPGQQQKEVTAGIRQPELKPAKTPLPTDQSPKEGVQTSPATKPAPSGPTPPSNTNPASAPGGAVSTADIKT